jgi:CubicO group peptidase (beta-lactamase class C family)
VKLRLLARALMGVGALAMASQAGGPAPRAFADSLDAELAAIAGDPAHPLASLSVLAIRDGEVVYHRQFGHRWIDNADPARSKPADAQTLYRIASISKLVTTLGVLRLVEAGKLSLDRDVGDYLGYAVRNPHFPEAPITLRMLLSHTSSLRDEAGYSWPAGRDIREVFTPGGELHGKGAMWSPEAAPGKFFHYANLPWGVVGTIMEKVTGERFDRLMLRLVLEPLGMQGGFSPADMPPARVREIATLYRKRPASDDKAAWDPKGPWIAQVDDYSAEPPAPRAGADYTIGRNGTVFGPQGNLRASAADLARVMLVLMGEGELEGRRFLERRTVALMLSRQWRYDGRNGASTYGSSRERCQAWGLGNQHFLDVGGPGRGDRLVEGGGFTGVGHHGVAWGLTGAFVLDPGTRNGLLFLAGGPGFDPETYPGIYSSFHRHEERILTALYRHALAAKRD